jgi:hypothetical protein
MRWPIADALVENRPNQAVLPHVRIKMTQQSGDPGVASNPIVKASLHQALSFFAGQGWLPDPRLLLGIVPRQTPPYAPQQSR